MSSGATARPAGAVTGVPGAGGDATLALRGITAGYGRATVLRDVTLEVATGQVVALLGANGAGKSTLLRVAAGQVLPEHGEVRISGRDATRDQVHRRVRAGLCLIPEGRGVFPSLTVRENLELQIPAWEKDVTIDAAVEAFPVLGDRLGQVAGTMSGGQQQMLALSRAVLQRPKVVMLDEVSMGLAPTIVDEIFASLAALARTGVALLLVEQYISRALGLAAHVYVLQRGSVALSAPPSEIDEAALIEGYLGGTQERNGGPRTP